MDSTVPSRMLPTAMDSNFFFLSSRLATFLPDRIRRFSSSLASMIITSTVLPSHDSRSSTYSAESCDAGINPRTPSIYATTPLFTTPAISTVITVFAFIFSSKSAHTDTASAVSAVSSTTSFTISSLIFIYLLIKLA